MDAGIFDRQQHQSDQQLHRHDQRRRAAGNISKVDIHTLLYAGRTTKVFAHYMPWWGGSGHVSIGLGDEANPAVVNAQVADAISRGIDGFIVDWYGPTSTHHNTATLNVKAAAEASTNFEFAISEDSGSLKGATDVTTKLLSDIQYMADNYFSSPRYLRWNGRPVVTFFLNTSLAINWATVRAQAAGNPVFIFRNASGFTDTDSDGSFAWTNVSSNVNDMGLSFAGQFLPGGPCAPVAADDRFVLQGLQRHACVVGIEPHQEPAVRADLAGDLGRSREVLLGLESAAAYCRLRPGTTTRKARRLRAVSTTASPSPPR